MTTCDATRMQPRPGRYGFEPVRCAAWLGIRTYVTTGGLRVGYCAAPSHEQSVRRQYAEQQDPPEPVWELGRDPDYDDPLDFVDHSPSASYRTEGMEP